MCPFPLITFWELVLWHGMYSNSWSLFTYLKYCILTRGYHLFLQLRYLYPFLYWHFEIYHILSCSLPCIFVSCHQPSYFFHPEDPGEKEAEIIDSSNVPKNVSKGKIQFDFISNYHNLELDSKWVKIRTSFSFDGSFSWNAPINTTYKFISQPLLIAIIFQDIHKFHWNTIHV